MNPTVSVLITSYNREKFIKEAIESVLASTYTNFELIVVDDCSTDNTFEIAKQFEKTDDRVKVFLNHYNLGQFANRNRALSYSKGELIKFLDSDDVIFQDGLTEMVESMQKFPQAGIGITALNYSGPLPIQLETKNSILMHYYKLNHLCMGPTSTIFTKDAISKVGGFEAEYGILADTLLNLKIASLFPTVLFKEGLYYWRIHEEQVTKGQEDKVRMIKERYTLLKAFLTCMENPLSSKQTEQINKSFIKINTVHILRYLLMFEFKNAISIKNHTELRWLQMMGSLIQKRSKIS